MLLITKRLLLPAFFYFVCFVVLTFPTILNFSTYYITDMGDGLQNIWNLWWVHRAVVGLHQLPWYTTYLKYPDGVTLLAHTMNSFNGFAGILLWPFCSLTQIHNFAVVFSFVIGGLNAFLFSYEVTRKWLGSFLAGFVFTFSNYHFSKVHGLLQLVSLEWIPLFLLHGTC